MDTYADAIYVSGSTTFDLSVVAGVAEAREVIPLFLNSRSIGKKSPFRLGQRFFLCHSSYSGIVLSMRNSSNFHILFLDYLVLGIIIEYNNSKHVSYLVVDFDNPIIAAGLYITKPAAEIRKSVQYVCFKGSSFYLSHSF
jgi:hypothetical protein